MWWFQAHLIFALLLVGKKAGSVSQAWALTLAYFCCSTDTALLPADDAGATRAWRSRWWSGQIRLYEVCGYGISGYHLRLLADLYTFNMLRPSFILFSRPRKRDV